MNERQQKLTSPTALYDFLDSTTKSLPNDEKLAGIKPLTGLANEIKNTPSDRPTFLTVSRPGCSLAGCPVSRQSLTRTRWPAPSLSSWVRTSLAFADATRWFGERRWACG